MLQKFLQIFSHHGYKNFLLLFTLFWVKFKNSWIRSFPVKNVLFINFLHSLSLPCCSHPSLMGGMADFYFHFLITFRVCEKNYFRLHKQIICKLSNNLTHHLRHCLHRLNICFVLIRSSHSKLILNRTIWRRLHPWVKLHLLYQIKVWKWSTNSDNRQALWDDNCHLLIIHHQITHSPPTHM